MEIPVISGRPNIIGGMQEDKFMIIIILKSKFRWILKSTVPSIEKNPFFLLLGQKMFLMRGKKISTAEACQWEKKDR